MHAVLSDRLVTIVEASLAQVARDNQRPPVIQRRADRDLAYMDAAVPEWSDMRSNRTVACSCN